MNDHQRPRVWQSWIQHRRLTCWIWPFHGSDAMGEFTRSGWNDWNYCWSHEFNGCLFILILYLMWYTVCEYRSRKGNSGKHPQILVHWCFFWKNDWWLNNHFPVHPKVPIAHWHLPDIDETVAPNLGLVIPCRVDILGSKIYVSYGVVLRTRTRTGVMDRDSDDVFFSPNSLLLGFSMLS